MAAPDGFEYTNEDGTISTVTYLFDNTTPSAPVLLVQINGTTQASIPLNSYDVNITTTGGFAFNPLTDVITITETDGETHTIDLTPLRTTVTSIDSSVGIVQSVNPDGSTNYDLGVKSHSNETQAVSYTGTELPVITGVNIGDTVTTNFTNGVAHYTFDGTNWVLNFFVPAGFAIDTLCDTTGTPVIVFADENGNLSYKNPDNTPYIGDPNLLENCCCTVSPIVSADANNDITIGSDGGAFYNSTNVVHSNEIQAVPYTGVELPLTSGINVGDTKTVKFNDGTVVNYTWDGSIWVKDFEDEYNFVGEINIVIDGQSNSIGQQAGSTFPLKVLNNLKVWNGSAWVVPQLGVAPFNSNGADNMGLRFAEKIALQNPQHRVNLIQLGNNGMPLSYWIASPYTGLSNALNTLNASGITRVDVFIWDQGESDNLNPNYIPEYYSGLIANLLSFPQIDERTKFLNVGMYTGPSALYPNKDVDFREIGFDNNEYTSYVNTENLEAYDNVHFTNQSMLTLGYDRIYNAYLNTPYTFKADMQPLNGLRLESNNIYRGSDSQTLPKGSQLIYPTYNHLNGFSDNWIGALGSSEPVQTISNTKDIFNRIVTIGGGDLKVNEVKVGRGQGDVITNTVVGRLALHNNTTGFYNDAKGYYSMHSNTTGSYNTANGAFSLYANLDGTLNSAFGYNSMGNSTGSYSTSFGAETLVNNVNVYNNAFGHNSLKQNTSGYQNCAYGAGSMLSNTDGYRNNAIGHYAMSNNINGSLNCALGYYSMSDGMSGTENTAIGSYSLRQTNGAYNVGIGTLSGESNTGNSNVFIGHGSGKNSINTDGSVFIGYNAGQNEISSNKLFICNSNTSNPLIGGDFSTQELKIGGVQQFSVQYPITGAGVANGSMFYGTDGALYFKGGSGTVTQIAPN